MAKKKKKRVLKVKNILILVLIILIIISIIYYALIMPIKNIYIEGNSILSDNEIIELSTLSNYPSFLLTKSTEIKTKLKIINLLYFKVNKNNESSLKLVKPVIP